jgi:hypothetical protein
MGYQVVMILGFKCSTAVSRYYLVFLLTLILGERIVHISFFPIFFLLSSFF